MGLRSSAAWAAAAAGVGQARRSAIRSISGGSGGGDDGTGDNNIN